MSTPRPRARLGEDELVVLFVWQEGSPTPIAYGPYLTFEDLQADGRLLIEGRKNQAKFYREPAELPPVLVVTERAVLLDPAEMRDHFQRYANRQRAKRKAERSRKASRVLRTTLAAVAFIIGAVILSPFYVIIGGCLLLLSPFIGALALVQWAIKQLRR